MTLIIDTASTARLLDGDALHAWAATHTAFISSEMSQLTAEREAVATTLRDIGMRVVMFEDLGGRDEDPERAYLDGVARSDVYVGIVGDRYGRMLDSGRSPTHDEFREAKRRGLRISVWVAREGSQRQGDARDFVEEVRVFHTTGNFDGPDDLARRVTERIAEIAADDEAPWVKVGDAVFRADEILDQGRRVVIRATVRDAEVARYLTSLRGDQWRRTGEVRITTEDRSGSARIEEVESVSRARSAREITLSAAVEWQDGFRSSMAMNMQGYSSEDQADLALRAGMFGEPLPERLGIVGSMVQPVNPLAPLASERLSEGSMEPIGRLLMVEHLVGQQAASHIDQFELGPVNAGVRPIRILYTEARQATNVDPGQRELTGEWRLNAGS